MLVCCCMKYNLRQKLIKCTEHFFPVTHIDRQGKKPYLWKSGGQLFLYFVQRSLCLVNQYKLFRMDQRDLTTYLAPDTATGSSHNNTFTGKIRSDKFLVEHNLIAAQKVLDINLLDL